MEVIQLIKTYKHSDSAKSRKKGDQPFRLISLLQLNF
jgi:hypothetical protein